MKYTGGNVTMQSPADDVHCSAGTWGPVKHVNEAPEDLRLSYLIIFFQASIKPTAQRTEECVRVKPSSLNHP